MNYKVNFENNKAVSCKPVRNFNDLAEYITTNNVRVIKSLIINALSEKEALLIATRLADKLSIK